LRDAEPLVECFEVRPGPGAGAHDQGGHLPDRLREFGVRQAGCGLFGAENLHHNLCMLPYGIS
jgi:hypothetical protein